MRIATQTGRVRPVWANGFAGSNGYDGDSSISIAIIDTGVDDSHTDLADVMYTGMIILPIMRLRPRYNPARQPCGGHCPGYRCISRHSTTLYYTDSGSLSGSRSKLLSERYRFPIRGNYLDLDCHLAGRSTTTLYHAYITKGSSTWYGQNSILGASGLTLNTSFTPLSSSPTVRPSSQTGACQHMP